MDGGTRAAGKLISPVQGDGRTRVAIVGKGGGHVDAEIVFGGDDVSDDGALKLHAIVAIADDLISQGADLGEGRSVLRVETSVRQLGRGGDRTMVAAARRIHRSAAAMVWQVTLAAREARDEPVAIVTQTLAIDGPSDRSRGPRPADGPIVGISRRTDGVPAEVGTVSPRREQIVAAAADIIARKGFAGASIREIADAAGMHVPTLYQYVASKDDLLELVYVRTMDALQTDLEAEVAGCATAGQKLRAAIGILVGRSDRFRHRIGLLNRELKSLSPKARARVLDRYRGLIEASAAIVRMGIATGEFRSVESDIVGNLVDAACDMWALRRFAVGRFGMEAFADEIADLIVRGLTRVTP